MTRETICFTPPSDSLRDKGRRGCNSGIVYSGLEGAKGITISQLGHSKDGAMWGGTRDTGASPEGHFEGRIGTLGDRIKGHRCSTSGVTVAQSTAVVRAVHRILFILVITLIGINRCHACQSSCQPLVLEGGDGALLLHGHLLHHWSVRVRRARWTWPPRPW